MTDEKIVSIDDELPIDRDTLLQKIAEVPEEFKREYVQGIAASIDELLLWKSIFTGSTSVAKHIIDGLDSSHFERFKTIVLNLLSADVLNNISKIREATFFTVDPIPESGEKALELIDLLKSLDLDCDAAWKNLIFTSRQLTMLASVILVLNMGKAFEGSLLDRLSTIPPSEFNGIIDLCKQKLQHQAVE